MSGELVLGANGGALLAEYGDAVALATQAADPCCNFTGDIPQRLRIDLWGGRSVCEVYVDEDCESGTVHYMRYRVERVGPDQQTRYLEVMPDGYGGWHVYVDPDDPERWSAIYTVPAGEQWLARRNYSYHLVRPGCSVELQSNQPYLQYWDSQIVLFHNDTLERPGLWMDMWPGWFDESHPPSPTIYTPNVDCDPHGDLAVPMPNRTWECLGGEQGVCDLGHYDVNFLNMRLTGEGVWVEPPPPPPPEYAIPAIVRASVHGTDDDKGGGDNRSMYCLENFPVFHLCEGMRQRETYRVAETAELELALDWYGVNSYDPPVWVAEYGIEGCLPDWPCYLEGVTPILWYRNTWACVGQGETVPGPGGYTYWHARVRLEMSWHADRPGLWIKTWSNAIGSDPDDGCGSWQADAYHYVGGEVPTHVMHTCSKPVECPDPYFFRITYTAEGQQSNSARHRVILPSGSYSIPFPRP